MTNNQNNHSDHHSARIDRREFVNRCVKAGVSVAAVGGAAYYLYDAEGPAAHPAEKSEITLPDFSVPHKAGDTMSIVSSDNRREGIDKAISLLGGMERFIEPNDRVVIKPNVAFSSPPALGATSHPEAVGKLVELSLKAGAASVVVTDNPINDPASCFDISGIREATEKAGGKVILPADDLFRNTTVENGQLIKNWPVLYGALKTADKLIGLAPVKHHTRSGASMTMKNWYGLLGGRRNIFHQQMNRIIYELTLLSKPTLVVLDGVTTMISNGPTGGSTSDLKETNKIVASCDTVAADSFGATLLGLNQEDLPYIGMAQEADIGTADYQSLKPQTGGTKKG